MCGRYDLSDPPRGLQAYFKLQAAPADFHNADVRPTNWVPIIRIADGARQALLRPCPNDWREIHPA